MRKVPDVITDVQQRSKMKKMRAKRENNNSTNEERKKRIYIHPRLFFFR